MKRKEVEDVIGGKDAWENVDRADGESLVLVTVLGVGKGGKGRLESFVRRGRSSRKISLRSSKTIPEVVPPRNLSNPPNPLPFPTKPPLIPTLPPPPPPTTHNQH